MDPIHLYSPAGLFAGEDRSVTNFASGLVRVEQTYYCPPAAAAAARVTLAPGNPMPDGDSTPAIDGLFIYPDAQEIGAAYGMKEFRVSAYGRATSSPRDLLMSTRRYGHLITGSATFGETISYSVWEPSGTVLATEDGTPTYDSLGLNDTALIPFDVRLGGSIDIWSVGSVVAAGDPLMNSYAGATLAFLTPPGAVVPIYDTPPDVTYGIQAYTATFTRAGSADRQITFYIYLPVVKIISKNSFGKYHEVTFTTERRSAFLAVE